MTMITEALCEEAKSVALKDIKLDPENIRLRHITEKLSEAEIEKYLLDEEDVRLTMKEIIIDKQIHEPLLVSEIENGKYIVKEGNRRLVALRAITKGIITGKIKGFEKDHFDIVSIQVLHGSPHDILKRIGQMHVSGKKEWKAHHKASVIFELRETYNDTIETIADTLGMQPTKVKQAYQAFEATTRYGKRFPNDKRYVNKYSYFAELYQSRDLKNWIDQDPTNMDTFIGWVGNNKLINSYGGVRALKKIIKAPVVSRGRALAVLDAPDGNIDKAIQTLEDNSPGSIWSDVRKLAKKLHQVTFDDFTSTSQDPTISQMLDEIIDSAMRMKQQIEQNRDGLLGR